MASEQPLSEDIVEDLSLAFLWRWKITLDYIDNYTPWIQLEKNDIWMDFIYERSSGGVIKPDCDSWVIIGRDQFRRHIAELH